MFFQKNINIIPEILPKYDKVVKTHLLMLISRRKSYLTGLFRESAFPETTLLAGVASGLPRLTTSAHVAGAT